MNIIIKAMKHFKLITTHKWYVFKNCCRAGIPIQGILHDLSKYSPTEFIESIKYYTGKRSPIEECKDKNGFSMAWYHHRGRNKHHWEFWVDNFELGMTVPIMPYKYAIESICDVLGASQAYNKDNWNFMITYKWWKNKIKTANKIIHPTIIHFIDNILANLAISDSYEALRKDNTSNLYSRILTAYYANEHDESILNDLFPLYPDDLTCMK